MVSVPLVRATASYGPVGPLTPNTTVPGPALVRSAAARASASDRDGRAGGVGLDGALVDDGDGAGRAAHDGAVADVAALAADGDPRADGQRAAGQAHGVVRAGAGEHHRAA